MTDLVPWSEDNVIIWLETGPDVKIMLIHNSP